MQEKMNELTSRGLCAFYYTSHANFLFVSESDSTTSSIKERLLSLGIPGWRLKPNQ
jgi:histidinol-phosphate/aromatic aminotransferase/cobyric acid decarboxylase-like protein